MIYLDYSATTPPSDEAIEAFAAASKNLFANPNSIHAPGREAEAAMRKTADGILHLFDAPGYEVVFTSGASEANNLAIKGYALRHQAKGRHLVTTPFEHASVAASFARLAKLGFEVDVVETDDAGRVTPAALGALLRPDTILVSVAAVSSELGIVQPIADLAALVAAQSRAAFMSDVTQAVGKIRLALDGIGLATFSAHKFYGLKGVGALLRRPDLLIEPQIDGGKSTTGCRSGTPALPLAVSMETALGLALSGLDLKIARVASLNRRLRMRLAGIPGIAINSPSDAVPHILNLSVLDRDADDMLDILDREGFCVSKQTACSSGATRSEAVFRLTGDERRARTSLRVSLSHLTTETEVDLFADAVERGVSG